MVNNQGFKEEYHKRPLNKIKRGFFNEVVTMAKNGDTAEQIWKYVNDEISRVYRLRKIRKTLKRTNARLIASFKRISLNFNRIASREYHSPSRKRVSDTKKSSSGDSGDSDQPGDPPRHHLNSSSKKPHCTKQNRFTISRRLLASCQCPMAQGVA